MIADGRTRQNLEFKGKLEDVGAARSAALRLGAVAAGVLLQKDTYFQVPSGRLKLREIEGEEAQLIHYERPENAASRWSRFTVAPVSDPKAMEAVLCALGIRAVVSKRRELYLWQDCRIHLDEVEGLGSFLEFEVCSAGDARSDRARMEALLTAFGLTEEEAIRASYADLLTD